MKSDNNKVLFITNMYPHPSFTYMGVHVKEQIDCLVKDFGINAEVYFINANEKGKLEYVKSIFKIYNILKKNKDIQTIHIHYGLSALFLAFFRPKAKIFLTFHGGDILIAQGQYVQVLISKYVAKKVDKIFILNKEMGKIVSKLNIPYEILPCGIDTEFFINKAIDKKSTQSKTILFPGDASRPVKNYPLFEEVIKILNKTASFKIKTICIHNLTRTEVRDLLNSADCLVMTSLSEGSPQIIKEALSCNLPVISVPVGDVETVIAGIPSCYTSNGFDPVELAELTIKVLEANEPNIRSEFLKKGIYENKSICEKLAENYRSEIS